MTGKDMFSKIIKAFGIPKLLLVLAAGALLVYLSIWDINEGGTDVTDRASDTINEPSGVADDNDKYIERLEKQVEGVLSHVSGVGNAEVMLTMESTAEKVVLKDKPYETETVSETDSNGTVRNKESRKSDETTIYVSDEGDNIPYIVKEIEPVVKGVLVVAEGGNDVKVKKEIIEAIQVLFGIESHKIKVMKLE